MCTVLMNTFCIAVCDILDIISSLSSFLVSHAPRLHLQFTHTSRCAVPRSTPMSSDGVFSSNVFFFARSFNFFFFAFVLRWTLFFFARGFVCLLAIGFVFFLHLFSCCCVHKVFFLQGVVFFCKGVFLCFQSFFLLFFSRKIKIFSKSFFFSKVFFFPVDCFFFFS